MKFDWKKISAWALAVSIPLTISIQSASGDLPDNNFSSQSFIPGEGWSCTEQLNAFIDIKGYSGALFNKADRDFFEQETGCIVEETNKAVEHADSNYRRSAFPGMYSFEYEVLDVQRAYLGGSSSSSGSISSFTSSLGSIPSWEVTLFVEYTMDNVEGWGLCDIGPFEGPYEFPYFSGEYENPSWPYKRVSESWPYTTNAHYEWEYWEYQYWLSNRDLEYVTQYSFSEEIEITINDQSGPIVADYLPMCGYDDSFYSADNSGADLLYFEYYLDPADLKDYEIPFYDWMGW